MNTNEIAALTRGDQFIANSDCRPAERVYIEITDHMAKLAETTGTSGYPQGGAE